MERFVGHPYVLTIDMTNPDELAKAYEEALKLSVSFRLNLLKFTYLAVPNSSLRILLYWTT